MATLVHYSCRGDMLSRPLRVGVVAVSTVLGLCGRWPSRASAASDDPLSFFSPTIVLNDDQRARLEAGKVIAKTLPADGQELAILAAGVTDATPAALVSSVRNIVRLKKSRYVPELHRFSNPPRLGDLASLTIDPDDVEVIKECRSDKCDLKLSADEITQLQGTLAQSGSDATNRFTEQFRRLVLHRVVSYLGKGLNGVPPLANEKTEPARVFSTLLEHSPYVASHAPNLAQYFERFPNAPTSRIESLLYWSKEVYAPHPIISVTHVAIARGHENQNSPDVVVMSRDVFSTRYVSGGLALTLLVHSESQRQHYLVYLNRSWVDEVHWLWRPIVEHRVKSDATKVFAQARQRIEAANGSAAN